MKARTFLVTTSALCLFPSLAWADAPAPVSWWVETRPWTCVSRTQPLAQHLQLACDASGGCTVASSRANAQRNAVLVCGEDGWTLEAESAAGERLWTLSLGSSDDEERLQRAAMWIARSEGTSAVAPPASTPVPTAAPVAKAKEPPERAPDADREPSPANEPTVELAVMGHGSKNFAEPWFGPAVGGRLLFVGHSPKLVGPLFVGLAGTAEVAANGAPYQLYRGGLVVGVGAPFDDHVFGVSVEGGGALMRMSDDAPQMSGRFSQGGAGYGQASLYAQIPGGRLRPFLAASVSALTEMHIGGVVPNGFVGLDLGLALGR